MSFNPIIPVSTIWQTEIVRQGKVIGPWTHYNVLTDQGLEHMLDVTFHGDSQWTPWYVVLFGGSDYTPATGNTYQSPGYTEKTGYDETVRVPFVESPASALSISNIANRAEFTMNAATTIYGVALVGAMYGMVKGDKDDTIEGIPLPGVLFCTSLLPTPQEVIPTDIVRVSCTIILEDV